MNFILGSSSPRRLELLGSIGINPDKIVSPDIDEKINKNESPLEYSKRISFEKINSLKNSFPNDVLLTADTVAYCGRRLIDKTSKVVIAKVHLNLLSGRRHRVSTSICIKNKQGNITKRTVTTSVSFKKLSQKEINLYLDTKEWEGVAGSYRIQGYASSFIKSINGSYTNVVGLPLYETKNLLLSAGMYFY